MESQHSHIAELTHELRAHLDNALAARDRAAAVEIALYAVRERGLPITDLYTRVLAPLLTDAGAAWQLGAERVWEEHFAAATVRTIVEGLYPDVMRESGRVPRREERAVLACPPGEQHDLGLRMVADRMQLAGWDTYFLGADTPVDEIAAAAAAVHADIIVLTAATHFNRVLLRGVIDELGRLSPDTRVGIGGPAFAGDTDWPADEVLSDVDLGISQSSGLEE